MLSFCYILSGICLLKIVFTFHDEEIIGLFIFFNV